MSMNTKPKKRASGSLFLPIVSCPYCNVASSDMTDKINKAGVWGTVQCHACKENFEIATAIDEMFINSSPSGYSLWTGGKQICVPIECESGKSNIVNIKGVFDEVYVMFPYFEKHEYLAGGFTTKYIPQGYAMVAIAPDPNGKTSIMKGNLIIEGRTNKQPKMETWKRMLLNAKLSIHQSPSLTVILALNSVDLYFEKKTQATQDDLCDRPKSWHDIFYKHYGIKLKKILGKDSAQIQRFVEVRNAIAHGGNHVQALPKNLIPLEEDWIKNGKYREGFGAVAPSASFSLRSALKIIRACERIEANGAYIPVFS